MAIGRRLADRAGYIGGDSDFKREKQVDTVKPIMYVPMTGLGGLASSDCEGCPGRIQTTSGTRSCLTQSLFPWKR